MSKEEADEVVDEIDVFVNQELADDLYVLQYPLRTPWNPYPPEGSAQFKQKSQFLRLKFKVPKTDEQKRIDQELTEQAEKPKESGSFTLESAVQPMGATYAIAILNEGQLHLNPLRPRMSTAPVKTESETTDTPTNENEPEEDYRGGGILQLRPSFSHLNPVSAEDTTNGKDKTDKELKKVQVSYQSRKQERIKNWEKNSYSYKQREFDEEPFVNLRFHHPDRSFEPYDKIQQLCFTEDEDLETPYTLTRSEYLNKIVGEASQPIPVSIPYGVCSQSKRETLPLLPQLVQLMRSVVLMRFHDIRKLISVPCEDFELIEALEKVAHVIDGVWIVKSTYCSELRDDTPKINTRDFILVQLFEHPAGLSQANINKNVPSGPSDVKEILSTICSSEDIEKLEGGAQRVWRLKIERENSFNPKYPEVVARSKQSFAELNRKLTKLFKKSDQPILDQFFAQVFAKYGVCNLPFLRTQMQSFIEKGGRFQSLESVSDAQFKAKLHSIAEQLHSAFYLKVHPTESWNKYRDVIISVFKAKKSPAVTKRDINMAAKKQLDAPIPEAIYKAIMNELSYSSKGTWIFRTGHGKDG